VQSRIKMRELMYYGVARGQRGGGRVGYYVEVVDLCQEKSCLSMTGLSYWDVSLLELVCKDFLGIGVLWCVIALQMKSICPLCYIFSDFGVFLGITRYANPSPSSHKMPHSLNTALNHLAIQNKRPPVLNYTLSPSNAIDSRSPSPFSGPPVSDILVSLTSSPSDK